MKLDCWRLAVSSSVGRCYTPTSCRNRKHINYNNKLPRPLQYLCNRKAALIYWDPFGLWRPQMISWRLPRCVEAKAWDCNSAHGHKGSMTVGLCFLDNPRVAFSNFLVLPSPLLTLAVRTSSAQIVYSSVAFLKCRLTFSRNVHHIEQKAIPWISVPRNPWQNALDTVRISGLRTFTGCYTLCAKLVNYTQ